MARINIDIPDDLHTELKVEAAERGTTLKDLIIDTLDKEVSDGQDTLEQEVQDEQDSLEEELSDDQSEGDSQ